MEGNRSQAYLGLSLTMLMWGSAFASSKAVVEQVPPAVAALLRFGGGALALVLAVAVFGKPAAPVPFRLRARACLAGVLGVFAYNGFFFWGLSLAPSLDGGILIPVLSPVLTSLFVLLAGRERASAARLAGLALGLAGAAVFFVGAGGGATPASSARLAGDVCYLLAALCWSGYTLLAPRVLAGIDPLRATTYATVTGAALLAVLAAPDLAHVPWERLSTGLWLNVAYLAVGAAALANLLYYRAVAAVGPASASLMMFTVPAVSTLCAFVLLGETFHPLQVVGAAVLLSGALLVITGARREVSPGRPPRSPRRVLGRSRPAAGAR